MSKPKSSNPNTKEPTKLLDDPKIKMIKESLTHEMYKAASILTMPEDVAERIMEKNDVSLLHHIVYDGYKSRDMKTLNVFIERLIGKLVQPTKVEIETKSLEELIQESFEGQVFDATDVNKQYLLENPEPDQEPNKNN